LAGEQVSGGALTRQLSRGGSPDPTLLPVAQRLRVDVSAWIDDAKASLGSAAERLRYVPLDGAVDWCTETSAWLRLVIEAVDHVSSVARRPVTLVFAERALHLAAQAAEIRDSVEGALSHDVSQLGPIFRGLATDWDSLDNALTWAGELRTRLGGPVHLRVAEAVLTTTLTSDDLRDRLSLWQRTSGQIAAVFEDRRKDEITPEFAENVEDVRALLDRLAATVGDIEEWALYVDAKGKLEQAGLEPVVSFCTDQRVDPSQVAKIVERALLEAWADDVLARDASRLGALRATDRDALVEEFRALDRDQISTAASRVINACAARRPTSLAGAAGTIQREAQKQRRHMPIRQLLSVAGTVARQLKPCFMMSPLSVSQYLPPTMRFDVVIFDEASQVAAVRCRELRLPGLPAHRGRRPEAIAADEFLHGDRGRRRRGGIRR